MSAPEDRPWYSPEYRLAARPSPRQPGVEVWRRHHPDGRVQLCQIRDHSEVGAGWDVLLLEADELLFSWRCVDEPAARYVAQALEQDTRRAGWTAPAAR